MASLTAVAVPDETAAWVADHQRRARLTGDAGIADLAQAAPHPTRDLVACTATFRPAPDAAERRQVVLVEAGRHRPVLPDTAASSAPVWSPDGSRLCVLASAADGLLTAVVLDEAGREVARATGLGGSVELARWSRDRTRLALVVADRGAEISDVWGSGTVGGTAQESWRPHVLPGHGGRRRLLVWDVLDGSHRAVTSLNVWEADWCGDDLVALVSEGAGENAWYGARLARLDLGGTVEPLYDATFQLARPTGSPDGSTWSALTGFASDRDLLAGSLVVGRPGSTPAVIATADTHVTEHRWVSDDVVLFIGHRGLDTVVGSVDVRTGESTEIWSGRATTGTYQPELGGLAATGAPVLVLEQHDTPPRLVRLSADRVSPEVLLDTAGPGDGVRRRLHGRDPVGHLVVDGRHVDGGPADPS